MRNLCIQLKANLGCPFACIFCVHAGRKVLFPGQIQGKVRMKGQITGCLGQILRPVGKAGTSLEKAQCNLGGLALEKVAVLGNGSWHNPGGGCPAKDGFFLHGEMDQFGAKTGRGTGESLVPRKSFQKGRIREAACSASPFLRLRALRWLRL